MARKLFITGTGTDVGKTYITALILKKFQENHKNAAYFKVAMSGNDRDDNGRLIPGDALYVKTISGIPQSLESMCPYVYENAYSPHLASRIEGNPVDKAVVYEQYRKICEQYDYVTLEGSGGILCPIHYNQKKEQEKIWLWEIIKELELGCLIVADAGLGTINDVGLTVHFMREKGISVKGIIFNHYHPGNVMEEDNLKMCEELTGVKVIACVKDLEEELDVDFESLELLYE